MSRQSTLGFCPYVARASHHPRENVQLFGSEFKVLPPCGKILPFSFAKFLVTFWVSSRLPLPK